MFKKSKALLIKILTYTLLLTGQLQKGQSYDFSDNQKGGAPYKDLTKVKPSNSNRFRDQGRKKVFNRPLNILILPKNFFRGRKNTCNVG